MLLFCFDSILNIYSLHIMFFFLDAPWAMPGQRVTVKGEDSMDISRIKIFANAFFSLNCKTAEFRCIFMAREFI